MSDTVSIQQRIQQLKKLQADLPEVLTKAAREATKRAIEATAAATPPKEGTGRGPYIGKNTITGDLKHHWSVDSVEEPQVDGGKYNTLLANNLDYASYVNDGHRMDRHFVPGLVIDETTGILKRNADGSGGIIVGTKTKWVKGEFMVDKGKKEYQNALESILDADIQEMMK